MSRTGPATRVSHPGGYPTGIYPVPTPHPAFLINGPGTTRYPLPATLRGSVTHLPIPTRQFFRSPLGYDTWVPTHRPIMTCPLRVFDNACSASQNSAPWADCRAVLRRCNLIGRKDDPPGLGSWHLNQQTEFVKFHVSERCDSLLSALRWRVQQTHQVQTTDPSRMNHYKKLYSSHKPSTSRSTATNRGSRNGLGIPLTNGLKPPSLLPQQPPLHRICPTEPFPPTLLSLFHGSGSAVSSPPCMSSQNRPLRRSFPAEPFPPALTSSAIPCITESPRCSFLLCCHQPSCNGAGLQCHSCHLYHLRTLPAASSLHFPSPPSPLRRAALLFTHALLLYPCEGLSFSSIPPALMQLAPSTVELELGRVAEAERFVRGGVGEQLQP